MEDIIDYLNNKGHFFKENINLIYKLHTSTYNKIITCSKCNGLYHIYSIKNECIEKYLLINDVAYEIYSSLDPNDISNTKLEDLISCDEQIIKNLVE